MSILFGLKWIHQSATANRPHEMGFATSRSASDDELFRVLNGDTPSTHRKFAVDKDGYVLAAPYTAGDLIYSASSSVAQVKRLTGLAIGTAGQALKVNSGATAPEWGTLGVAGGGTGLTTFTAAGRLVYSTAATTLASLAIGTANQLLQVNSGATAPEWTSTITSPTLAGTVAGTPTWASTQAVNISGSAPAGSLTGSTLASGVTASSLTSVGTLTGLTTTGQVLAAAGGNSVPSYSFSGDPDTGMYSIVGAVRFTVNGVFEIQFGTSSGDQSALQLNFDGTVRAVQRGAMDSGGSGFRQLVVVN